VAYVRQAGTRDPEPCRLGPLRVVADQCHHWASGPTTPLGAPAVRLILAPQIGVGSHHHQERALAELDRQPTVEVPDGSDELLKDAIASAIRANPEVVGAEPQLDSPPYSPDVWWLAVIERPGDPVGIYTFPPTRFYGIDADGRVRFPFVPELRVSDLIRAIDEGHYPTSEHSVIVTRSGEWGGNGHAVVSLAIWLLEQFPAVLVGWTADRASLRRDTKQREEFEALAADWAARRIEYPGDLRKFIQTREVWFPSRLAERLAISDSAAERLLQTLGYEPAEDDLMEYTGSAEGSAAREAWERAERTAEGYATIDEMLDAREAEPSPPSRGLLSRLGRRG
jgi:hypothetical protein